MVEESASVLTPPGKKMKQARLPFAPVNKQSSKFLQKDKKSLILFYQFCAQIRHLDIMTLQNP